MRFTSLGGLMRFILFLQGLGFKYPGSLYDLHMRLKTLPFYISAFQVDFMIKDNNFYIMLEREGRTACTIELKGSNCTIDLGDSHGK